MRLSSIAFTLALVLLAPTAAMAGGWGDYFDRIDDGLKADMDHSNDVSTRKRQKMKLTAGRDAGRSKARKELNGSIEWLAPNHTETLGTVD